MPEEQRNPVGRPPGSGIAHTHKQQILTRMAAGESLTAIAQSLGYADHAGIINRLDDDPDYQAALRSGAIGKVEKREKELEDAEDKVTISRADRLLAHARWWAGAVDPQRFGQRPANITINNNVLAISDSLVGTASDLLGKLRVSDQSELSTVQHEQIAQETGK